MRLLASVFVLACLTSPCGCGNGPVAGGTSGVLRVGATGLGDMQVTIHRIDAGSAEAVGFGVTTLDGRFELMQTGASGPLWLPPGEYVCTLETIGPPVAIPREYTKPDTSPLKVTWANDRKMMELETPEFQALR